MNEFTKEELQELYDGLYFEGWREDIKDNPHYQLMKKIQSMIDNYCEHKITGQVSDVDYVNICVECKELTGWI
jgi:hypothetical protein